MYLDHQYERNIMCYNYFTIETRVSLKNLLQIKSQKGLTYRAIGNILNMSHSTIIREVNSNGGIELYDPHLANTKPTKNKVTVEGNLSLLNRLNQLLRIDLNYRGRQNN